VGGGDLFFMDAKKDWGCGTLLISLWVGTHYGGVGGGGRDLLYLA